MSKRQPLSKRMRFAVLERDGFCCRYCGARAPDVSLHVDHVTPVVVGGRTVFENLVTACEGCNLGKAASVILDGIDDVPERAIAAAMMLEALKRWPLEMSAGDFEELDGWSRINGPQPHLIEIIQASSSWRAASANLCREFGYPEHFWELTADPLPLGGAR